METQWTRMTADEAAEIIQHNDLDAVFSPEVDAPAKAAGSNDLFNESAVEYSGLELHETDEERDAAILSDDLFESDPQTGEQGDED